MNKVEEMTVPVVENGQVASGDFEKKFSPVLVETEKMFDRFAEHTRETAQKAYEFFQSRGGGFGRELDDWFKAESKILRPIAVEVVETEGAINVSAAVPGFKPEEIEISVKENMLIISGRTDKAKETSEGNLVYTDWESNKFYRHLTLPSLVDAENVRAELKDGVLKLSLSKVAAPEVKHIAVTAG